MKNKNFKPNSFDYYINDNILEIRIVDGCKNIPVLYVYKYFALNLRVGDVLFMPDKQTHLPNWIFKTEHIDELIGANPIIITERCINSNTLYFNAETQSMYK